MKNLFERLAGQWLNVIYATALIISSPWLAWRFLRYGKNRRGWSQKLWGRVPLGVANKSRIGSDDDRNLEAAIGEEEGRESIWLHAVSVGEVNLLAPIIERLKRDLPDATLSLSTSTETGYDLACNKYIDITIFFFPYDFTWAVNEVLRRIRPSLIVLAELEIWPNLISIASRYRLSDQTNAADNQGGGGIPIAVVNGRLSESSFRGYRRLIWPVKSSFQKLALVAVQDEIYAERFRQLGCDPQRVVVTGSVKFDGIRTHRANEQSQRFRQLFDVRQGETVFLAGSTQLEEDLLAAQTFLTLIDRYPNLRLILAPRHPERCDELEHQLKEFGLTVVRRSKMHLESTPNPFEAHRQAILMIDVIGELGGWWGVADIAYVGGSMGKRGGQNMIEPAAYGIPVSFGPNTKNFQMIVSQLLAAHGAQVVSNQQELTQFVERCLSDRPWAHQLGQNAQIEVLKHQGASDRTIGLLKTLLDLNNIESNRNGFF
jgi:3-deoxy-D-manno-octulosonic-acid transferase